MINYHHKSLTWPKFKFEFEYFPLEQEQDPLLDYNPYDFDIPLMESFAIDPIHTSLDFESHPISTQDEEWSSEFGSIYYPLEKPNDLLMICNGDEDTVHVEYNQQDNQTSNEKALKKKIKVEEKNSASGLSREVISRYFYVPITQASKELNIGLTLLKKRCRELGIRRWPHRKLMSLQALIKNLQDELRTTVGEERKEWMRYEIYELEGQLKRMEELPDLELKDRTRRLRQACFKANYKKRKLLNTSCSDSPQRSSTASNDVAALIELGRSEVEDEVDIESLLDEEIQSLLCDTSCSNLTFMW